MTIIHSHLNNCWYLLIKNYNTTAKISKTKAKQMMEHRKVGTKCAYLENTLINTFYKIK